MRIPEQKIDEIRQSANIVDIISTHVQLKKRGKNFIGLCPFHSEKTPSFVVSEDKQIYRCFGCASGGNIFKFLMDYKNISFIEAVQEIADFIGYQLKMEESNKGEDDELEILYDINLTAARFFTDTLYKSSEGEIAREYLKKRNIKPQIQKSFGLGFAPSGWNNFYDHAVANKLDLEKTKLLGLIDKKENGKFYDKYRGRIIFPIFSPNGRVIAFGGRILENSENAAKYLNSPENPIYLKRKSLYGLYHSKEEIRKLDKVILVEGYLDLISLFQNGVKNVVASSGTSLTEEQVQLLSRFTKNIVVLFDSDEAGQKAALRSIEILIKSDFEVKVALLPKGEDPDSYIQKNGKEVFDDFISRAQNFLEFRLRIFEERGMLSDPNEATKVIRETVRIIALVNDKIKQGLLITSLAKKFNLREKMLESELIDYINKQSDQKKPQKESERASSGKSQLKSNRDKSSTAQTEKELIRLLFSGDNEILSAILNSIEPSDFTSIIFKELSRIVVENYEDGLIAPAHLIEQINDSELKEYVFNLLFNEEEISPKWSELSHNGEIKKDKIEYAIDTIRRFKVNRINEQLYELNKKISETSDSQAIYELMKSIKDLEDEKRRLMPNSKNNNEE
ncbi:MAG: DNA primase [Ignavibacteriaceae bacterium]|jgi:DNA primase|nr:DNA primase [Ignavibacteriaceae bacterium]